MFEEYLYCITIIYITIPLDVLYSKNFIIQAQENLFLDPDEKFELKASDIKPGSANLTWKIPPEKLDYIRALRMNCTRTQSKLAPYLRLHDKHVIVNPTIAKPNVLVTPLESSSKYSCVLIGAVSLSVGADDQLIVLSKAVTFETPIDSSKTILVPSASNTKAIILVTVVPIGIIILSVAFMVFGYYLHKRRLRKAAMEPGEEPLLVNVGHNNEDSAEDSDLDKENRPLQKNTNLNNKNMQRLKLLLPTSKKSSSNHERSAGRDVSNKNGKKSSSAKKDVRCESHDKNVARNSNTHGSHKHKDRIKSSVRYSKASNRRGSPSRSGEYDCSIEIEDSNGCDKEVFGIKPSRDLRNAASRSTITSTASFSTRQSSVGLGIPRVNNTAIQRSFCSWPVHKERKQSSSITCMAPQRNKGFVSGDHNEIQATPMYARTLSAPNITRKYISRREGLEIPDEVFPAATKNHSYHTLYNLNNN